MLYAESQQCKGMAIKARATRVLYLLQMALQGVDLQVQCSLAAKLEDPDERVPLKNLLQDHVLTLLHAATV